MNNKVLIDCSHSQFNNFSSVIFLCLEVFLFVCLFWVFVCALKEFQMNSVIQKAKTLENFTRIFEKIQSNTGPKLLCIILTNSFILSSNMVLSYESLEIYSRILNQYENKYWGIHGQRSSLTKTPFVISKMLCINGLLIIF